MASLLRMPEISANTVEAVLSEWPLPENASFAAGDPIATVETEKAVVDVPAESAGVLVRTLVEPGKTVSVGTPMAVLAEPDEVIEDVDAVVEQLTGAAPPAAAPAAEEPTPAGTREVSQAASPAAGEVPGAAPAVATSGAVTSGVATSGVTGAAAPGGAAPTATPTSGARVFASPLARRIAKENGLAIADIHGTGPGGRIVRDDVRRALDSRMPAPALDARTPALDSRTPALDSRTPALDSRTAAPSRAAPVFPDVPTVTAGGYTDVPHSRMRRAIATRLTRSVQEAPVFTIRGSARVDRLLALRAQLNEEAGIKVSVNDLIVAAAARAHGAVPEMNVVWTADAVRRFRDVDIAVAVATDDGLVTPVVRGVRALTVSGLAARTADLVARARDGKLRPDELEGGTLTVTNLGVFGTEDFTAVINPPQAAILAVGATRPEAVVTDGEIGVATVLRVTLSVDHRPVDGAIAARWMGAFLRLLEAPLRILA